MPPADADVALISHVIQLATAPVFLITGVAALLGVMATRLARIVDRARWIEAGWSAFGDPERTAFTQELVILRRRAHLSSWAINFAATSALLVSLVIVTLFIDAMIATRLRWVVAFLFIFSMLSLIAGVICFLREVYLATHTLKIGPPA
jgi:hypothetical protein